MNQSDRDRLQALLPETVKRHGIDRVVSLVESLGPDWLKAAIDAERAQFNSRRAYPQPARPELPSVATEPAPAPMSWPEWVKVWPSLFFACRKEKLESAWRAWSLVRAIDQAGSGQVLRSDVLQAFEGWGIGERKRRRWIAQAVEIGLLKEHTYKKSGQRVYFIVSLQRAAQLLGAVEIGRPAKIQVKDIIKRAGWRGFVWAGYLTGYEAQPMAHQEPSPIPYRAASQRTKAGATGVSVRTQRAWQNGRAYKVKSGEIRITKAPEGSAIKNYAPLDHIKGDQAGAYADALNDQRAGHFFEFVTYRRRRKHTTPYKSLVQKLPDSRVIPVSTAQRLGRGRGRKAQAALNSVLSNLRQDHRIMPRLFNRDHRETEKTLRRIGKSDMPAWERPEMLFELQATRRTAQLWRSVAV